MQRQGFENPNGVGCAQRRAESAGVQRRGWEELGVIGRAQRCAESTGCGVKYLRSETAMDALSGVRGSRGAETTVRERGFHACSQPSGMRPSQT